MKGLLASLDADRGHAVGARTDRTPLSVVPDAVAMPTRTKWPHAVFVAWLDQLKESLGVRSDKELGERLDISPSLINGWRHARSQPSLPNLRKLALAADVPPARVYALAGRLHNDVHTEEATGSIPVSPTSISAGQNSRPTNSGRLFERLEQDHELPMSYDLDASRSLNAR
jgi:transcriptional regulator with XRE-family HTH domain